VCESIDQSTFTLLLQPYKAAFNTYNYIFTLLLKLILF